MLIYPPIFDTSHCVYRSLLLLQDQDYCEIDIELFRLMDFYVLFPSLLKFIKPFPNELRRYKKEIQKISDPYENIQNPNRIFIELRRIQSIAFHHLLSKNLIDMQSYTDGKIKRTKITFPEELSNSLRVDPHRNSEWFALISKGFLQIEFYGSNGLKKRTGLMEYRYDEVDTND